MVLVLAAPWSAHAAVPSDPAPVASYTASDGFTIDIYYDLRAQIGVAADRWEGDLVHDVRQAVAENYEQFLSWGLERNWEPDRGAVRIVPDCACIAKFSYTREFWIAIDPEFMTRLRAEGYDYPDARGALTTIIGHEMFHQFQTAHFRPPMYWSGGDHAYTEGTARFQEALHPYSAVSHQPYSLFYKRGGSSCNFGPGVVAVTDPVVYIDNQMASGPFHARSYNACHFWMAWYTAYGPEAFVKLITESMPAAAAEAAGFEQVARAVTAAAGRPLERQLVRWAEGAILGRGYDFEPPAGRGAGLDWAEHFDLWMPRAIAPGQSASGTLQPGGVMARELHASGRAFVDGPPEATLAVLRDDGSDTKTSFPAQGEDIRGPRAGERVWLVVANPRTGQASVTLRVEPAA